MTQISRSIGEVVPVAQSVTGDGGESAAALQGGGFADHAHNARIDEQRYKQRSLTDTVNSADKRSLGVAVRAQSWFREFREIALMCGSAL